MENDVKRRFEKELVKKNSELSAADQLFSSKK